DRPGHPGGPAPADRRPPGSAGVAAPVLARRAQVIASSQLCGRLRLWAAASGPRAWPRPRGGADGRVASLAPGSAAGVHFLGAVPGEPGAAATEPLGA